jgi:Triose-phosphate Transporter family
VRRVTRVRACSAAAKIVGEKHAGSVVTLAFIAAWYSLNVGFNLCNKSLFNVFPFPWFVSTIHVVVGALYCGLMYLLGFKDASFERPLTKKEFMTILGPASMHALGHVAANLSFAAVAISLTHTVKTLEPLFNVGLSAAILGQGTSLPVCATLVPVVVRSPDCALHAPAHARCCSPCMAGGVSC